MKSVLPKRKRSQAPTPAQLKTAEDAVFTALRRGNAVLVIKNPSKGNKRAMKDNRAEQDSIREDEYVSFLSKTSQEDFLSSFRVNGLECMTTAYE